MAFHEQDYRRGFNPKCHRSREVPQNQRDEKAKSRFGVALDHDWREAEPLPKRERYARGIAIDPTANTRLPNKPVNNVKQNQAEKAKAVKSQGKLLGLARSNFGSREDTLRREDEQQEGTRNLHEISITELAMKKDLQARWEQFQ